jgi:hypothetical protein
MSKGMKESADVSDLEFFRRPMAVSEPPGETTGSTTHTKNNFATIQDAYYLVPGCPVGLNFQQL